jgi:hypothetical protein
VAVFLVAAHRLQRTQAAQFTLDGDVCSCMQSVRSATGVSAILPI